MKAIPRAMEPGRVLSLISLALLGCASTPPIGWEQRLSDQGYKVGRSVDGISGYRVDGFNALDDRHVLLNAGPSDKYLVTLLTSCTTLRSTERIGFTTLPPNRLTTFDQVIVPGTPISQRCPIASIQALEKLQQGIGPSTQ